MPFDTAALAPASHTEAAALAYAARLDVLLALSPGLSPEPSEALHDALMAVGELLGGLGCKGFSADLRAHLARVEEDMIAEAGDYDGDGPRNPYARMSDRLSDFIDQARADDALDWMESAKAAMARVLTLIAEASRESAPGARS